MWSGEHKVTGSDCILSLVQGPPGFDLLCFFLTLSNIHCVYSSKSISKITCTVHSFSEVCIQLFNLHCFHSPALMVPAAYTPQLGTKLCTACHCLHQVWSFILCLPGNRDLEWSLKMLEFCAARWRLAICFTISSTVLWGAMWKSTVRGDVSRQGF